MPTFSFYNHTAAKLFTGDFDASDTFKVILLSSSATFDATDTTASEVTNAGAWEVYGNGWSQGGYTLSGVTIGNDSTDDAMLDADDVSQVITGGDLGPFSAYAIVDTTLANSPPLCFIALDAPVTILENNAATITWNSLGIIRGVVS
jgi:hypothetical protein